jgi:hypothetical protein
MWYHGVENEPKSIVCSGVDTPLHPAIHELQERAVREHGPVT